MEGGHSFNIQQNIKALTLKALNKAGTIRGATGLLGCTERTIHNYLKSFNIKPDGPRIGGKTTYSIKQRTK